MCRNSFRIRAERKIGQLLKDTPKKTGARGIGKKVDSPAARPLADLGDAELWVRSRLSLTWQLMRSFFFAAVQIGR